MISAPTSLEFPDFYLWCLRVAKIPQDAVLGLVHTSDYSGKGRDMQLVANKLSALALLGSSVTVLDLC